MKHVLFISFLFKKYKKDLTLRIFVDDQFIDEITLSDNINPVANFHELHGVEESMAKNISKYHLSAFERLGGVLEIPSKIWTYVIDICPASEPKIRIQCQLDDNNYTNGFMTRTASFKLKRVALLPLELLQDRHSLKKLWQRERDLTYRIIGNRKPNLWFTFPSCQDARFTDNQNKNSKVLWDTWCGSSGTFTIDTVKKHKILLMKYGLRQQVMGYMDVDPFYVWLSQQERIINSIV